MSGKPDPWAPDFLRRIDELQKKEDLSYSDARERARDEMELTDEQAQRAIDSWTVSE